MNISYHSFVRKILATLTITLLATPFANAQTDAQLTQYWAVPSLYNPAATGSSDYLRIRGFGRLQWVGIENAPKSFGVVAESPFQVGKTRIGLGANLGQESLGLFSNFNLNLQFSYKLKLFNGELGLGIQAGLLDQKFEGSKVFIPDGDDYHQSSDEAIPTQDMNGTALDLGAGIFYTHKLFYAGIGAQHLTNPKVKLSLEGSESTDAQEYEIETSRMMYFTAGSNIGIKNTLFELMPSVFVKTDFSMFTAEATLQARYNKFLRVGIGYRYKDAVSIMIGADIKNFFIGYSYDYATSAISKASSGSHEIVAGYQLKLDFNGKNKNKHRNIRIM